METTTDPVGQFPDTGYWASQTLHVDCTAETAATVVVDATDVGGEIESVEFGLHEGTTHRLEGGAGHGDRACEEADRIAAAEGSTVGEVVSVTPVAEEREPTGFIDEGTELAQQADFEPDPVVVSETLDVTYALDGRYCRL